jgi:amino acid permease
MSTDIADRGTGTLPAAAVTLFVGAAGAGLLSYPFAVLTQGYALTIVLTFLIAALIIYSDLILVATAYQYRKTLYIFTYEELGTAASVFC